MISDPEPGCSGGSRLDVGAYLGVGTYLGVEAYLAEGTDTDADAEAKSTNDVGNCAPPVLED